MLFQFFWGGAGLKDSVQYCTSICNIVIYSTVYTCNISVCPTPLLHPPTLCTNQNDLLTYFASLDWWRVSTRCYVYEALMLSQKSEL